MGKNIIKILVILALLIIVICRVRIIKSEIFKRNLSNEIKAFLNTGKHSKYLVEDQKVWLENAKSNDENNYDITEFIDYFIKTSKKCVEAKLGIFDINNHKEYKKLSSIYDGISVVGMMNWFYTKPNYMMAYITDEDIELYKSDKLENKIKDRLKDIFNYSNGKWYISGDEGKRMDLLYGIYVDYSPNKRINNIKPKEITSISILNKYIESLDSSKDKKVRLKICYDSESGEYLEKKTTLNIIGGNKKVLDLYGLAFLYYSNSTIPKLAVRHHSKDAEDEEYLEWERAKIKAEEERDPSKIEVRTEFRDVEIFEKYKQYAEIYVIEYEDGSSRAFFRKHINYMVNEKRKVGKFMRRELPYKNKTIEEVMELYLNDKEQYSIDEELLKNGIELVKYDSYEM